MNVGADRPSPGFGPSPLGAERLAMLTAVLSGDMTLAHRLAVELLAHGVALETIVADVLTPIQDEVGERWAEGDLGVADEHAASAVIEELVVRLSATAEDPSGPTVVVASPARDIHALGARVVASALVLDGLRVLFLGAAVPAGALEDYLELHRPLALALSCSLTSALVEASASIAAAHRVGIPVVGGGRAVATAARAARLGLDALASTPQDAVAQIRAWEAAAPAELQAEPERSSVQRTLAARRQQLIATALEVATNGTTERRDSLAEELARLLQVVEAALLLEEPALVTEHLQWLRVTAPGHGVATPLIDDAVRALAAAMDGALQDVSLLLA